ncbi:hypothetical protein PIB30_004717 [Stylosanthes scabra]|uniref:Uncharacterized protein n=1 Tax=Stylosanthes scabra TaxID=79078 RepID=A0ABU6S349_9FABA|nr:hypothetical protein [Stylosanthes scabra]
MALPSSPPRSDPPLWINDEGDFRFPLSWNEDWVIPKVERKDLSESELLLIDALIVPPTSSVAPDSSSARDTSATPSPSIVSAQEIDNRNKELQQAQKRKNPEPKYGYINSKEFDHVGFAQEYLVGGNNKIPMDGENFLKNLDFVTRNCIKAAAICQAAQNKVRGSVLVPEGEAAETEKRVIEGEKFELSSKVSKLEARLAVESQDLNAVKEALKKSEKERSECDEKYRKLYGEFKLKIENQKKLEAELQDAQELYDKFSNDAMLLAEEVAENLKDQIRVLLPDFDVGLIGPDNKVVDRVIVRPEPVPNEEPIPEQTVAGGSEQAPNAEGSPEARPTMSDPPPTPPCHGI